MNVDPSPGTRSTAVPLQSRTASLCQGVAGGVRPHSKARLAARIGGGGQAIQGGPRCGEYCGVHGWARRLARRVRAVGIRRAPEGVAVWRNPSRPHPCSTPPRPGRSCQRALGESQGHREHDDQHRRHEERQLLFERQLPDAGTSSGRGRRLRRRWRQGDRPVRGMRIAMVMRPPDAIRCA